MNKNRESYPIDFVVLWVDGSDPKWLEKKKKYKPELSVADEEVRYRDWGIFKYWFRAVERYAPWVNHVYIVTDNQKPKWLNDSYSKLTIVDHSEIIDKKYLPTFNSQAIEMNLHKIPGLSEHFVYFNDDMFLAGPVQKTDFFRGKKIVESAVLNSGTGMNRDQLFARTMFNDALLINRHFHKKDVVDKHIFRWINPKYGLLNIRTVSQMAYPYFTGFKPTHSPAPMLKQSFIELWNEEGDEIEATVSHKFRNENDLNQYIFTWWQMCNNGFTPKNVFRHKYVELSKGKIKKCIKCIKSKKFKTICLNDCWKDGDYRDAEKHILEAFEQKLGKKSLFEV